jgi:hypothetical protein
MICCSLDRGTALTKFRIARERELLFHGFGNLGGAGGGGVGEMIASRGNALFLGNFERNSLNFRRKSGSYRL